MVDPWISQKKKTLCKVTLCDNRICSFYIYIYLYVKYYIFIYIHYIILYILYVYYILNIYILSRYYFWSDHIALAIQDIFMSNRIRVVIFLFMVPKLRKTINWAPPLCEHPTVFFYKFHSPGLTVYPCLFVDICCISISVSVIFRRLIIWLSSTFLGHNPQ
jgi:hypothetical protein